MKTIRNALLWMPAVLWYRVIWGFSAQTAAVSGALSDRLLWRLMAILSPSFATTDPATQNTAVELLSHVERKAAHMFIYFVLALLIWLALAKLLRKRIPQIALTLLLCAGLAGLDEFHQTYVSGRSGQVSDVFVDLAGAGVALALLGILFLTARWRADCRVRPLALLPAALCVLLMALTAALPHGLVPVLPLAEQFINSSLAGQAGLLAALAPIVWETFYLLSCALLGCGAMLTAAMAGLSLLLALSACLTVCCLLGAGIALLSGLPVALLAVGAAAAGVLASLILWLVCRLWAVCTRG